MLKQRPSDPEAPGAAAQLVLQDHPIAPTELPKGWSTIQLIRHYSTRQSIAYIPPEEDTFC